MTTRAAKKKTAKKTAKKKRDKKAATKPDSIEVQAGWLNKKQMAASLGISTQAFDQYGIEPVAKRHKFGEAFYTCEQVVAYKVRRAIQVEREKLEREISKRPGADVGDLITEQAEAELQLTRERAETQRLKNAQLRRELAPVEIMQIALGQLAAQVSSLLDPLPGKIRRRQPRLSNADVEAIRHECVKAKNAAAELEINWDEIDIGDPVGD